jgi:DNA invertase Pin-like site-specific DNA recombinase
VDRLGRSTIDLLNALNALQAAGVGYCATSQGIDTTTAAGRMLASFLSVLAQWEREVIVGRVVSGLQRARANGVALGRPRVAVDIRRAVALRATGMGYKQVAKALGIPRTTLYRTLSAIPQTPVAAAG